MVLVNLASSLFHIDQTVPCQELTHEIKDKTHESVFTMHSLRFPVILITGIFIYLFHVNVTGQ